MDFTSTFQQQQQWQIQLDELTQRLQSGTNLTKRERSKILASMGALCSLMGRTEEMVSFFSEARELGPDISTHQDLYALIDLYRKEDRVTPWDVDAAVSQYDDVQELITKQNLPFEAFFSQIKRGRIRKSICRMVLAGHKPGQRLLEVGCAAGGYYGSLRPFADVSRYAAVDITPAMVKKTKKAFPALDTLRMDVRELAFPDDSFPVVFSTDVLMHVENWRSGLQELYRVTEKMLVLRIRVHLDQSLPTRAVHIGHGKFRVPYIINNAQEFDTIIREFSPAPADILKGPPIPEPMYDDLWQIAREHPDLVHESQESRRVSVDCMLDLAILKRR